MRIHLGLAQMYPSALPVRRSFSGKLAHRR